MSPSVVRTMHGLTIAERLSLLKCFVRCLPGQIPSVGDIAVFNTSGLRRPLAGSG